MKNLITITSIVLSFVFLSTNVKAAYSKHKPKIDSSSCLEIDGKLVFSEAENEAENDGTCKIELLKSNVVQDSLVLQPGKNKFRLVLKKDCYYTIRVTKKGYASKLICVNTAFNAEVDGLNRFKFTTELLTKTEAKHLDQDNLDFPIAIIYFDDKKESFEFSQDYTYDLRKNLFTSISMN